MIQLRPLLLLSALLLHSSLSHAEEPLPLASGWWEITTRPDFINIPASPAPKIDRLCLNASDIKSGKIALRVAATCKVAGGEWNKNSLTPNIFCSDAPPDAKISAELNANGTSFTSFIQLNPQIRYNHSGKWLSAQCQ